LRAVAAAVLLVAPLAPLPASGQTPEPAAPEASEPLRLEQVLTSVEEHYPLLEAARAELERARGARRAAAGSFDTRVVAEGDWRPTGFYDSTTGDAKVEQPTRFLGAKLYGGYRIGRGDYPSYEGGRQTDRGGEFRGGLELPLLRGSAIDPERAELRGAELDVRRAEPEIALQRIGFLREATLAYWDWVATGLAVEVARQLLGVAEQRQEQLDRRVARGVVPRIDLVDNERLIVDRRIRLRGAERDAEQAAIALSLFLRDAAGEPVIVPPSRLPDDFPAEMAPGQMQLERDLQRAAEEHPLLQSLGLRREKREVELRLARNDRLPEMDLQLEGSRDRGDSVAGLSSVGSLSAEARDQTEVKALLRFELPLQQREARGRAQVAEAELRRLTSRLRFARERIQADIRKAMAGLRAAYAQAAAARENLELARRLEAAEERKLRLGTSNLIDLNIRELQAADAAVELIETQASYFRALAEYRAAVAVDL